MKLEKRKQNPWLNSKANPGPKRHKTCLIINNIQSWAWQSVVVYPTFNDLRSWNMFFPLHCVKWVISWNFWSRDISRLTRRVADRNATCRETWRVGECHVPDTRDTACHDKSRPVYVNRQRISRVWYLTARMYFVVEWMYFVYLCPSMLLGNHKRLCSFVPSEFYS